MTAQTEPQALPETGEDDAAWIDPHRETAVMLWSAHLDQRNIHCGTALIDGIATAISAAVEAEREAACLDVCLDCQRGIPRDGRFHYIVPADPHWLCKAAAIRARGEAS